RARAQLRREMGTNPYPVPAAAHHIFGVEFFNTPLGRRLHGWGIDLNGRNNGVMLPTRQFPGNTATIHRGRTGSAYNAEVVRRLDRARSKEEALHVLAGLKQEMLSGTLRINKAR